MCHRRQGWYFDIFELMVLLVAEDLVIQLTAFLIVNPGQVLTTGSSSEHPLVSVLAVIVAVSPERWTT